MVKDELNQVVAGAVPGRRRFLRAATLAGAAGAVLLTRGTARADRIFNGGNQKEARSTFLDIQRHENAHVAFLVNALGGAARPKPAFRNLLQPNFRQFALVSQALENTGVGAYLGAAPVNNSRARPGTYVTPAFTGTANMRRPSGLLKNSSRSSRDQSGRRPPSVEICCRFPSCGYCST